MWGLKGSWGGGWGEEEEGGETNYYSPAGAAAGLEVPALTQREGTFVRPTPLIIPGQLPRRLLTSFFMSWGGAKPLTSLEAPWRLPLVFSPCPAPVLGTCGSFHTPATSGLVRDPIDQPVSVLTYSWVDEKQVGYFGPTDYSSDSQLS